MDHLVQYEFSNFEPGYDVRSFICIVSDRIHGLSPSDSVMKVVMKRVRDRIKASCRIASGAGTFFAETVCDSPELAIQEIEKKMRRQLKVWKSERFRSKGFQGFLKGSSKLPKKTLDLSFRGQEVSIEGQQSFFKQSAS